MLLRNTTQEAAKVSAGAGADSLVRNSVGGAGSQPATPEGHVYTIAEIEEHLGRNAAALAEARKGLGKPYKFVQGSPLEPQLDGFTSIGPIPQLMELEALLAAHKKQWPK